MQQSLETASNEEFGGIVVLGGFAVDEDVARVSFYSAPQDRQVFLQAVGARCAHVSCSILQPSLDVGSASDIAAKQTGCGNGSIESCMAQKLRALIFDQGTVPPAQVLVIEVGGTAGEQEHALMLRVLCLSLIHI